MSARLRATPWFRAEEDERLARADRTRRVMFPPPSAWILDIRPFPPSPFDVAFFELVRVGLDPARPGHTVWHLHFNEPAVESKIEEAMDNLSRFLTGMVLGGRP